MFGQRRVGGNLFASINETLIRKRLCLDPLNWLMLQITRNFYILFLWLKFKTVLKVIAFVGWNQLWKVSFERTIKSISQGKNESRMDKSLIGSRDPAESSII